MIQTEIQETPERMKGHKQTNIKGISKETEGYVAHQSGQRDTQTEIIQGTPKWMEQYKQMNIRRISQWMERTQTDTRVWRNM